MKKLTGLFPYLVVACITLGLAPFFPEPHIVGKLRWIAGGAVGMQTADLFDLFLHGVPLLLLVIILIVKINTENEKVH